MFCKFLARKPFIYTFIHLQQFIILWVDLSSINKGKVELREQNTAMSKRKGEELAGPSRKKTTSQAGASSRVSEEEDEDEMNLTQRADFDINSVWVIISNSLLVSKYSHSQRKLKNLVTIENNDFHTNSV